MLPDDGKRKKAVVRQTLSMLIDRCGGFEQILIWQGVWAMGKQINY